MAEMKDRRIVVTGGATGIGLATAERMTSAGAEVCVVGRRSDVLDGAVERLGPRAWCHVCDISDQADVEAFQVALAARWEAVDGLVNNAGVAPMATLDGTDVELWDHTFGVNVRGPFLTCRTFSEALKRGVSPSVVNVSSTLAERAIPGMAAYNASKAALNQLTRSLALEWAPTVRVNGVMPAVVDTPIHATRGMSSADVAGMGEMHPLQRVGRPEDVANLIHYLLSDAASWMTGAIIPVDGGMMAG